MPQKPPIGRPFKKGESGNPLGARIHNPVKKEFKKLAEEELRKVCEMFLCTPPDELRAAVDKSENALVAMIGEAIVRGVKNGDYQMAFDIVDRIMGVKQQRWKIDVHVKPRTIEEINAEIEAIERRYREIVPVEEGGPLLIGPGEKNIKCPEQPS